MTMYRVSEWGSQEGERQTEREVVPIFYYYFMMNAIIYSIVKIIPFEYPCDSTGHSRLLVF